MSNTDPHEDVANQIAALLPTNPQLLTLSDPTDLFKMSQIDFGGVKQTSILAVWLLARGAEIHAQNKARQ